MIEGIVLQRMADEIVNLSEQFIGTMEDQDIFGGLYGSMTMLTAMQAATPASVRWFLEYVNAFPEKHRGQVWKVTETFATWAINDTPIPNKILEEKLDAIT